MHIQDVSNGLATAVEVATPALLGATRRRGMATLTAIAPDLLVGAARLAHRAPSEAIDHRDQVVPIELAAVTPALGLSFFRTTSTLTPVQWNHEPRVGHIVLPTAYGPRATLGLVAQLGGPWLAPSGHEIDRFIHVDGNLPPGFAGGPLLSADGTAIGINVRRLVRGGTTIPGATLERLARTVTDQGSLEPGFLGIGGATATLTPRQAEVAGQPIALLVVAVEADSPADGVLTVGDIVLAVNGTPIPDAPTLRRTLASHAPGDVVKLDVLEGAERGTREVTLGRRPSSL